MLVSELAALAGEGRVLLWSREPAEESALAGLGVTGTLATENAHEVYPVVINASGTKLDTYLDREVRYSVGRCPIDGRVASQVEVVLTSDLPDPLDVDPFVLGLATGPPNDPVQRTQVQLHTSADTTVAQVNVDGDPTSAFTFVERGRPSAVVTIDLPPRTPTTVTFVLDEQASDEVGRVQVQPLVRDADVSIDDVPCGADGQSER